MCSREHTTYPYLSFSLYIIIYTTNITCMMYTMTCTFEVCVYQSESRDLLFGEFSRYFN